MFNSTGSSKCQRITYIILIATILVTLLLHITLKFEWIENCYRLFQVNQNIFEFSNVEKNLNSEICPYPDYIYNPIIKLCVLSKIQENPRKRSKREYLKPDNYAEFEAQLVNRQMKRIDVTKEPLPKGHEAAEEAKIIEKEAKYRHKNFRKQEEGSIFVHDDWDIDMEGAFEEINVNDSAIYTVNQIMGEDMAGIDDIDGPYHNPKTQPQIQMQQTIKPPMEPDAGGLSKASYKASESIDNEFDIGIDIGMDDGDDKIFNSKNEAQNIFDSESKKLSGTKMPKKLDKSFRQKGNGKSKGKPGKMVPQKPEAKGTKKTFGNDQLVIVEKPPIVENVNFDLENNTTILNVNHTEGHGDNREIEIVPYRPYMNKNSRKNQTFVKPKIRRIQYGKVKRPKQKNNEKNETIDDKEIQDLIAQLNEKSHGGKFEIKNKSKEVDGIDGIDVKMFSINNEGDLSELKNAKADGAVKVSEVILDKKIDKSKTDKELKKSQANGKQKVVQEISRENEAVNLKKENMKENKDIGENIQKTKNQIIEKDNKNIPKSNDPQKVLKIESNKAQVGSRNITASDDILPDIKLEGSSHGKEISGYIIKENEAKNFKSDSKLQSNHVAKDFGKVNKDTIGSNLNIPRSIIAQQVYNNEGYERAKENIKKSEKSTNIAKETEIEQKVDRDNINIYNEGYEIAKDNIKNYGKPTNIEKEAEIEQTVTRENKNIYNEGYERAKENIKKPEKSTNIAKEAEIEQMVARKNINIYNEGYERAKENIKKPEKSTNIAKEAEIEQTLGQVNKYNYNEGYERAKENIKKPEKSTNIAKEAEIEQTVARENINNDVKFGNEALKFKKHNEAKQYKKDMMLKLKNVNIGLLDENGEEQNPDEMIEFGTKNAMQISSGVSDTQSKILEESMRSQGINTNVHREIFDGNEALYLHGDANDEAKSEMQQMMAELESGDGVGGFSFDKFRTSQVNYGNGNDKLITIPLPERKKINIQINLKTTTTKPVIRTTTTATTTTATTTTSCPKKTTPMSTTTTTTTTRCPKKDEDDDDNFDSMLDKFKTIENQHEKNSRQIETAKIDGKVGGNVKESKNFGPSFQMGKIFW